jgi:uncharacterized protein (DUF1786 family)
VNPAESILAVDVGSGTQDILVWMPDIAMENCPKLVLPSQTTILARRMDAARAKGQHLFLSGSTMGGGACSAAVRAHLKAGLRVYALREPALTLHDDLDRVKAMGVRIVEARPELEPLTELAMSDIDLRAIHRTLGLFEVAPPRLTAVSVQDHGFSPAQSNRAFRFTLWSDLLRAGGHLEDLLYETAPDHLTRMQAVQKTVPGAFVMDTGASAVLGALLDPWLASRREEGVIVVNAGNEHTVSALIKGQRLWGIYEHHTSLLSPETLREHLVRFRRGDLSNQEIYDQMGHGCTVLPGAGEASPFEHIGMTGPNRGKFEALRPHMAAPFGDMMLTGCFGLLHALRRHLAIRAGE